MTTSPRPPASPHRLGLRSLGLAVFALAAACATAPATPTAVPAAGPIEIPFDYVGPNWIRIPVALGDVNTRVLFDTGGGVSIVSDALCRKLACVPDGQFTGKRMSGQDIEVHLARIPSVTVGGRVLKNARVAVFDTASLLHPDLGVDGVLGLDLFRDQPLTLDYARHLLVLEDAASLEARRRAGASTPVRVENDGPSTVIYLPMALSPETPKLEMEVDTGSHDLILDARFMSALGIDPAAASTHRVEGKDETANPYVRFYGELPRGIPVVGIPEVAAPAGAKVMFQRIIHDGLVGHVFLSAHAVTFDVPGATMIFSR